MCVAPHPNPGPTRRSLSLLQTTFLMPSSHLIVLLRSDGPDFWQSRKHTTLSTLHLRHPLIERAAPDELAAPKAQVWQVRQAARPWSTYAFALLIVVNPSLRAGFSILTVCI